MNIAYTQLPFEKYFSFILAVANMTIPEPDTGLASIQRHPVRPPTHGPCKIPLSPRPPLFQLNRQSLPLLTECADPLAGDGAPQRRQRHPAQTDGVIPAQVAAVPVPVERVGAAREPALVGAGRLTRRRGAGEFERVPCENAHPALRLVVPAVRQLWGRRVAGQVRSGKTVMESVDKAAQS